MFRSCFFRNFSSYNSDGRTGVKTNVDVKVPTKVDILSSYKIISIKGGRWHAIALTSEGKKKAPSVIV
jgi:hypothetical protein